jgi:hypothetical protein
MKSDQEHITGRRQWLRAVDQPSMRRLCSWGPSFGGESGSADTRPWHPNAPKRSLCERVAANRLVHASKDGAERSSAREPVGQAVARRFSAPLPLSVCCGMVGVAGFETGTRSSRTMGQVIATPGTRSEPAMSESRRMSESQVAKTKIYLVGAVGIEPTTSPV